MSHADLSKGIPVIYGTRYRPKKRMTAAHDRVCNLHTALQAAHRLRRQRIYTGTLQHWQSLLEEANQFLGGTAEPDDGKVRALTVELEAVVAARLLTAGRPAKPLLPS